MGIRLNARSSEIDSLFWESGIQADSKNWKLPHPCARSMNLLPPSTKFLASSGPLSIQIEGELLLRGEPAIVTFSHASLTAAPICGQQTFPTKSWPIWICRMLPSPSPACRCVPETHPYVPLSVLRDCKLGPGKLKKWARCSASLHFHKEVCSASFSWIMIQILLSVLHFSTFAGDVMY